RHLGVVRHRHAARDLAGGRIEDVAVAAGLAGDDLALDPVFDGGEGGGAGLLGCVHGAFLRGGGQSRPVARVCKGGTADRIVCHNEQWLANPARLPPSRTCTCSPSWAKPAATRRPRGAWRSPRPP